MEMHHLVIVYRAIKIQIERTRTITYKGGIAMKKEIKFYVFKLIR